MGSHQESDYHIIERNLDQIFSMPKYAKVLMLEVHHNLCVVRLKLKLQTDKTHKKHKENGQYKASNQDVTSSIEWHCKECIFGATQV